MPVGNHEGQFVLPGGEHTGIETGEFHIIPAETGLVVRQEDGLFIFGRLLTAVAKHSTFGRDFVQRLILRGADIVLLKIVDFVLHVHPVPSLV